MNLLFSTMKQLFELLEIYWIAYVYISNCMKILNIQWMFSWDSVVAGTGLDGWIVMHRIIRPWYSRRPRMRKRLWAAQVLGLSTSVAFICSLSASTSSSPINLHQQRSFFNNSWRFEREENCSLPDSKSSFLSFVLSSLNRFATSSEQYRETMLVIFLSFLCFSLFSFFFFSLLSPRIVYIITYIHAVSY